MAHDIPAPSSILLLAALLGAGCSRAEETDTSDALSHGGSHPSTGGEASLATGSEPSGSAPCDLQPVHYAFDSSDLDATARQRLQANSTCMRRGTNEVVVTGRTDPRGTEEYNLALGDRRARAATEYMQALGVAPERLKPRSVGEEMAAGDDETGWADDRRADFESW
ncbi:MAG: OmpA family protein [Deltaproteobacteria bacterium]|nr:OmpA family protein [Deltaproteobacteria bacterium]